MIKKFTILVILALFLVSGIAYGVTPYYKNDNKYSVLVPTAIGGTVEIPPGKAVGGSFYAEYVTRGILVPWAGDPPTEADIVYTYEVVPVADSVLPDQTNADGKFLKSVTGSATWEEVPTFTTPVGCIATSVPFFLGSPLALTCDNGLTYDAPTQALSVAKKIGIGGTIPDATKALSVIDSENAIYDYDYPTASSIALTRTSGATTNHSLISSLQVTGTLSLTGDTPNTALVGGDFYVFGPTGRTASGFVGISSDTRTSGSASYVFGSRASTLASGATTTIAEMDMLRLQTFAVNSGATVTNGYGISVTGPSTFPVGSGSVVRYAGIAFAPAPAAPVTPTHRTMVLLGTNTIPDGNWAIYSTLTDPSKFSGIIEAAGLKVSTGAGLGKVWTSDADGLGSWIAPAVASVVIGTDKQIPYNDNGTMSGITSFTYDKTSKQIAYAPASMPNWTAAFSVVKPGDNYENAVIASFVGGGNDVGDGNRDAQVVIGNMNTTNGNYSTLFFSSAGGQTAGIGSRNLNHLGWPNNQGELLFYSGGGGGNPTERGRFTKEGYLFLGVGADPTDDKLYVVGTARVSGQLVAKNVQLTDDYQASCNSTIAGRITYTQGAGGSKDKLAVCAKDASDVYAWRTIY